MNQEEPRGGGGLDPCPNVRGSVPALGRDARVRPCSLRAEILPGFSRGNNFYGSNQPYMFWVWAGGGLRACQWWWGLALAAEWELSPGPQNGWGGLISLAAPQRCPDDHRVPSWQADGLANPREQRDEGSWAGGIRYVCFRLFPHCQVLL